MSKLGHKKDQTLTGKRGEVLPRIIQLGGSLPASQDVHSRTWTPSVPEKPCKVDRDLNGSPVVKCPKFKNLNGYSQTYNDSLDIKSKLWLTPEVGNNIQPQGPSLRSQSQETIGLYRRDFQKWYNKLIHENTIVLPPIDTSKRVKETIYDSRNLREKKYIAEVHKQTGPRERFTRDELYVPDVYQQCFTCNECHRQYANDMFARTWSVRNSFKPTCNSTVKKRTNLMRQTCDVLGERYCKSCIESRNRNFSLKIENKLINNNDLKKVHYKSALF
ncbi:hypothetical protein ACF0H5_007163 [Mactra antiquata]